MCVAISPRKKKGNKGEEEKGHTLKPKGTLRKTVKKERGGKKEKYSPSGERERPCSPEKAPSKISFRRGERKAPPQGSKKRTPAFMHREKKRKEKEGTRAFRGSKRGHCISWARRTGGKKRGKKNDSPERGSFPPKGHQGKEKVPCTPPPP